MRNKKERRAKYKVEKSAHLTHSRHTALQGREREAKVKADSLLSSKVSGKREREREREKGAEFLSEEAPYLFLFTLADRPMNVPLRKSKTLPMYCTTESLEGRGME